MFNQTTKYAFDALNYMHIHAKGGQIMSKEIADACGISMDYLPKVLQQLVKANVVHSKRGPRGGFKLVRPLKQVSVLCVIVAIQGPIRNILNSPAIQKEVDRFTICLARMNMAWALGK